MKAFDDELVSGSIPRSVWKLAWPIVLMNLVIGVQGMVDQILVGHYVQEPEANAAIGIAWNVFLVVVVMLASLFQGMGVVIAQSTGRQDREAISHTLYHVSLATVYLVFLVVAPIGFLLSPHILAHVNATAEVQRHAAPYLRTMFLCGITLSANFLLSTALQSAGEPKVPLVLVIMGTVLHAILTTILISGAGLFTPMGTAGAALGDCLAPIPGILIVLYLVFSGRSVIPAPKHWTLIPDLKVLSTVARIGIPTGIHAVVLNIGAIFLYRYIGSLEFSAAAQAAYTVCYAQLFSFVTWPALGLRGAASALMGQNIGAGKYERGRSGVYLATRMGALWAVCWGAMTWFSARPLLAVFGMHDPHVTEFGTNLLRYLAFSGLFLAMALTLTGGLFGAGETKKPMWIAIVTQIGVLLGTCHLFKVTGVLTANAIWLAIFISHFTRFLLTWVAFRTSRWRVVQVQPESS